MEKKAGIVRSGEADNRDAARINLPVADGPGLLPAGNFAMQRLSRAGRSLSLLGTPPATTRDGITTFHASVLPHPISEAIHIHEAIHRAQFSQAGLPPSSRADLEEEAGRGTRALMGGRSYRVEGYAAPGETYSADADWYRRAAGFSSGMEAIGNVVREVARRVRAEQAEWYVFSDRVFTRPVVNRILGQARGFRSQADSFIQASPADEPMLPQLRSDLTDFTSAIEVLEAELPAPIGTGEMLARGFSGGVMGAGGSFLGFLRLGLWDSWGQFLFDGSETRISEAQDGLANLMTSIDEQGLWQTVSHGASDWFTRYSEGIENEYYTTASEQFGATGFDIYFAGRGLISAGQGLAGLSRAAQMFRLAGNPAPWRAALRMAASEAISFRGVGAYGGSGLLGTRYGLPTVPAGAPRVRVIRFITSERDLVAKVMRESPRLFEGEQPRTTLDIAETHRRASAGSPMQSAYPYADAETMLVANPEGFSAAQRSPYYVVIEIPLDEGVIDINRTVAASRGLNPADVPELTANRYGMRLPSAMRPTDLSVTRPETLGAPHEHLPPALRAWAEANVDFPAGSPAPAALEGVPYLEWEQVLMAADLRPFVVEIRPNPAFSGARPPLNLQAGAGSPFHPAMDPVALSALARTSPEGMRGFLASRDWLLALSRSGGGTPLTPSQILSGERFTYFGGRAPEFLFPLGAAGPATAGLSLPHAQPSSAPPASDRDMAAYVAWIQSASGQPLSSDLARLLTRPVERGAPPVPVAMQSAMRAISTSAATLSGMGRRVTGLRAAPNLVTLEVRVGRVDQVAPTIETIVTGWGREGRDVEAGVVIIVDSPPPSGRDPSEAIGPLTLPRNLQVRILDPNGNEIPVR
ncbi:MAG: hypothetical protein JW929_09805 [Anaerolineales bacterium]|nr:hypothetical protein [Anaerolineales bacterium]